MTSLIFGVICIYLAVTILRMPKERFKQELDQISGHRKGHSSQHSPQYYQVIRGLLWAIGFLGVAMIVLRFF